MYLVKNTQNFCEVFFFFFQFYHLGISFLNQRDLIMQKSPIFICRECVFNKISILLKMQYKLFTTLIHLEFYIVLNTYTTVLFSKCLLVILILCIFAYYLNNFDVVYVQCGYNFRLFKCLLYSTFFKEKQPKANILLPSECCFHFIE